MFGLDSILKPVASILSPATSLLGLGGGGGPNASFQGATLLNPFDQAQAKQAYDQANSGVSQQQQFVNALMAQNGLGNQANVYNQYQGIANGTGPNPALAQLANTTGQNVAAQAALMAGQRGTGSNAGLLARQIGQQGAGIQQNAAGQAAALQAQQQLNALGAMGNIAGQQVGQQQQGLQGYNQAAQGLQGNVLSGLGQYNNSMVSNTGGANNANAGMARGAQAGAQNDIRGITSALPKIGSTVGAFFGLAEGGEVPGPSSQLGQFFKNKMACGGMMTASKGKVVPGKASVKGDSYKNDTVPAMLSPGEVVIPRHVMQSDDPANSAAKFVQAVLAKHGMRK